MKMKKILAATNNVGKLKEIKEILKDFEILSLKDINCEIEVEEDGKTFKENSIKKAKEIFEITKIPCISDDSGICINKLDGWPGVYTARFLGEYATQEERNNAMINKLNSIKAEDRSAKVECVISYVDEKGVITTTGEIEGKITEKPRGENGFGFDSIFELDNGKTLAELTDKEKNVVSSRKIALNKLRKMIDKL